MLKLKLIIVLIGIVGLMVSFISPGDSPRKLRKLYSKDPSQWPAPTVDPGIEWMELGYLPESTVLKKKDSLRHLVELGKVLFFDPRLSGSGKISCATCHQPERSWTDGLQVSEGHEGAKNKRNSPTILNSWFYTHLFWDGRARDLEDQSFAPINSESEMHGDMRELPRNLRNIKGYAGLFKAAFGDPSIDPDRIATAIATFERTIVSQPSRFDKFLAGDKRALSDEELEGLHIFRTKGRCMNCHHGPMFTDNLFHHNGFADPGLPGRWWVTKKNEDSARFKTPSLRDVVYTGPWMESGQISDLRLLISMYADGKYPGYPAKDKAIHHLNLKYRERQALLAFLNSISSPPPAFSRPILPE